jgi:hypothetical protein
MTTTPTTEQKVASALRMKQEIIGLMLQHLEENGLRRSMHMYSLDYFLIISKIFVA